MGLARNNTEYSQEIQPDAAAMVPPSSPLGTGATPQTQNLEQIADAYIKFADKYQQPGKLDDNSWVPSNPEARQAWFALAEYIGDSRDKATIVAKLKVMQSALQGPGAQTTQLPQNLKDDLAGLKIELKKPSWDSIVQSISQLSDLAHMQQLSKVPVWDRLQLGTAYKTEQIDTMLDTAYKIVNRIRPSKEEPVENGGGSNPDSNPNELDPNHREVGGYQVGNGVGIVRVNVGLPSEGGFFGIGSHEKKSTDGLVVTSVDKALEGKIKVGWVITEYGLVDDAGKKVNVAGGPEEDAAAYERFRQFQRMYRDKKMYVVVKDPQHAEVPPAKIPYSLIKDQRTGFGFTSLEEVRITGQQSGLKISGILPNNPPAGMLPKDFIITNARLLPRVQGETPLEIAVASVEEFKSLLEKSKERKLEVSGWQVVDGENKRVSFLIEPKSGYYDFEISDDQRGKNEKKAGEIKPSRSIMLPKSASYGKTGGDGDVPFEVEIRESGIWPFNRHDDPQVGLKISQISKTTNGLRVSDLIVAYGLEGGPMIDFRKKMDKSKDGLPDREDYEDFKNFVSQNPGKKLALVVQPENSKPGSDTRELLIAIENRPVGTNSRQPIFAQ